MPDLRTIPGVELARTGTYDLSTGPHEFTRSDLQAAIANATLGTQPRVKLGHIDPRFDGEPAMGVVANMRLGEDGDVLIGDLVNVPGWLADALPAAYPGRSIEASVSPSNGMRITALALLGMTRPGIDSLADLEFALAAAARQTPEDPAVRQIAVAITQLRASVLDQQYPTQGPETGRSTTGGRAMTRIEALRALGLPETVTDDQINQALAESPVAPVAPEDPVAPTEDPNPTAPPVTPEPANPAVPVTPAEPNPEPVPVEVPPVAEESPVALAASAMLATVTQELAELRASAAARDAREVGERRDLLASQWLQEGRITLAERDHYRGLLDIDEDGVVKLAASLAIGRVPVTPPAATHTLSAANGGLSEDDMVLLSQKQMGHTPTPPKEA